MDQPKNLHPVIWVAAVSVTILSAVGVAAIMGILPYAGSQNAEPVKLEAKAVPATPAITPPTVAAPAASPPAEPVASLPAAPAPVAKEAAPPPREVPKVVKQHKPVQVAQAGKAPPADAVAPPPGTPYPPTAAKPAPVCHDCGTVESVRHHQQKGQGSGLGAIAGGVLGGVLGNQVGAGRGRDVATVVGAVAGGYAGNEVEKSQRATSTYEVVVRFDDGTSRVFKRDTAPPWQAGDRVKVVNGDVVPR